MRKNRKYSKAECLSYLEEYMCSSQNHSEFEREKGLKRTTISRWLRIFGIEDKPSPIMSKKLSQTEQELHDRIHELERKIKSLEVELKQSNMARDRIRKSPLKFYAQYYSILSGDFQALIITEFQLYKQSLH